MGSFFVSEGVTQTTQRRVVFRVNLCMKSGRVLPFVAPAIKLTRLIINFTSRYDKKKAQCLPLTASSTSRKGQRGQACCSHSYHSTLPQEYRNTSTFNHHINSHGQSNKLYIIPFIH